MTGEEKRRANGSFLSKWHSLVSEIFHVAEHNYLSLCLAHTIFSPVQKAGLGQTSGVICLPGQLWQVPFDKTTNRPDTTAGKKAKKKEEEGPILQASKREKFFKRTRMAQSSRLERSNQLFYYTFSLPFQVSQM